MSFVASVVQFDVSTQHHMMSVLGVEKMGDLQAKRAKVLGIKATAWRREADSDNFHDSDEARHNAGEGA